MAKATSAEMLQRREMRCPYLALPSPRTYSPHGLTLPSSLGLHVRERRIEMVSRSTSPLTPTSAHLEPITGAYRRRH